MMRMTLTLGLLTILSISTFLLPLRVYAFGCSASQSAAWQICGPIVSPTGLNVQPSVVQANDGTLKMAWTARPLSSYLIFYASGSFNGSAWNWGAGASPTTQGGVNQNPALAQLPNGTFYPCGKRQHRPCRIFPWPGGLGYFRHLLHNV